MTPEAYESLVYWGTDDPHGRWTLLGKYCHGEDGKFYRFTISRPPGSDPNEDDDRPAPMGRPALLGEGDV